MKIMGFNFNKMSVEKNAGDFKGVKIKNSVDVLNVDLIKSDLINAKEQLLGVSFKFDVEFGENIAKIHLEGVVLLALEVNEAKKTIENWKNKNLSDEYKIPLLNLILRKSNIKALELGEEFNLPPHIQLPSLKSNTQ